jgi:hypothetical protein
MNVRIHVLGTVVLLAASINACSSDGDGSAPPTAPADGGLEGDARVDDGGGSIATCTPPDGKPVEVSIPFPSGARVKKVRPVVDSFGASAPPPGTVFEDVYTPQPGECSVATHDRYWVCGSDGRAYRTWHPSTTTDVLTGKPCSFGHEHGDDPRTSPLYAWSGGVPFGIANHAAMLGGSHHRHEDHVGHKVFVQNDWEAVLGNPPDDGKPIALAGFHCHWLSQLHQGSHSGDAFSHNEHEYENNIMCDDGAARHPDPGFEANAGPQNHTEASIKTLTAIGDPGQFYGCENAEAPNPICYPSGVVLLDQLAQCKKNNPQCTLADVHCPPSDVALADGRPKPVSSDTQREIKCTSDQAWWYRPFPTPIKSETGDVDWTGSNIGELWKPWIQVVDRDGNEIFLASGYYVVANPVRLYANDLALVPKRDVDGDGNVDDYLPTLDVCLAKPDVAPCKGLAALFPTNVPKTEWWRLPQNPYNGTIRILHPKGVTLRNGHPREVFCTDYRGVETKSDPVIDADGLATCPDGQLLQRVARTVNWWGDGHATWGPSHLVGHPGGSSVNSHANKTIGSGFLHEWVRFYDSDKTIHAPN